MDTPTSGEVYLGNIFLNKVSKSEMADIRLEKIGFIFQSYNLIPVMNALENVEFGLLLQKVSRQERKERAIAILKELGIENLAGRRPSDMSGGQQQRVAIARAIVTNPIIVLADEPTANLDSETGSNLLELMAEMNTAKGITFIFSSHDPMVMECARRLIILKDGIIVEDKNKDNI